MGEVRQMSGADAAAKNSKEAAARAAAAQEKQLELAQQEFEYQKQAAEEEKTYSRGIAAEDRATASDTLVRHFGGRLVGLYYTPGAEYDGFALFEAPGDAAAAAVEIAAIAAGYLRRNRLLRVLSAEEMHAALQQAATAPDIAPKATG